MKYSYYRGLVQAKTDGANVHSVNQYLGHICNALSLMESSIEKDDEKRIRRYKSVIENAVREIYQLTRVSCEPSSLTL